MNKLEFGLFLPNTSGVTVIGSIPFPENRPTFELNKAVTQMAEDAGFDYALSQVKWRGYGGETKHWDHSLEAFALVSALAAVTSKMQLYASVAIRTIHPSVIAKMAATIDDVSGGRFGVNIVSGWNKVEYDQFGLWDEDAYYNYRYQYAEEYMAVLNALWTEDEANYKGRFFEVKDAHLMPKPSRRIPIVCAGQSEEAVEFIAKYADFAFVGRMKDDVEALAALSDKIKAAAAPHGRDVGSLVLMTVIAEETDEAAFAKRDHYMATADDGAIRQWMGYQVHDTHKAGIAYDTVPQVHKTFMGLHLIAGSYETVAKHMDALAARGVKGVCLSFPDYLTDLPRFIEKVLPKCESYQPDTLSAAA